LYILSLENIFGGFAMNIQRINEILKNKEKCDVFYEDKPVWIQEVRGNTATVGFVDGSGDKDIYIEELYEDNLYI